MCRYYAYSKRNKHLLSRIFSTEFANWGPERARLRGVGIQLS